MKADRLLSMLLLLQTHGRMTGRDLARRLEVSARTVHRDMEALCSAGVPVYAHRGSRGGWQLDEGWETNVPGLEETELRALLMAQPPRVLGDLKLASAAERALGKLMASLPVSLRQQAVSIRQRLHVDVEGWRGTSENLAMLPVVQDAVWRNRRLTIRYLRPRPEASSREVSERTVDPLGLVVKGSGWYLVANTAEGFRTFRVSRIQQATMLEEACERPADFDLATHWNASTTSYRETFRRYEVALRLAPPTADWLRMWRSAWLVEAMGEPDADGWIPCRVQFECEDQACFVVLGFGRHAEILAPDSLRDRVLAEADAIVSRERTAVR